MPSTLMTDETAPTKAPVKHDKGIKGITSAESLKSKQQLFMFHQPPRLWPVMRRISPLSRASFLCLASSVTSIALLTFCVLYALRTCFISASLDFGNRFLSGLAINNTAFWQEGRGLIQLF